MLLRMIFLLKKMVLSGAFTKDTLLIMKSKQFWQGIRKMQLCKMEQFKRLRIQK